MDGPENRVSLSPWFLPRRCCYSLRIYDDGSSSSSTVLFWWHADADAVQQLIMRQYVEWSGGVEPVEVGWVVGPALHCMAMAMYVTSSPDPYMTDTTALYCAAPSSILPPPAPSAAALPFRFTVSCRCEMWTMRANIYISHRGGSVRSIGGLLGSFCPCHHLIRSGHCAVVHHVTSVYACHIVIPI